MLKLSKERLSPRPPVPPQSLSACPKLLASRGLLALSRRRSSSCRPASSTGEGSRLTPETAPGPLPYLVFFERRCGTGAKRPCWRTLVSVRFFMSWRNPACFLMLSTVSRPNFVKPFSFRSSLIWFFMVLSIRSSLVVTPMVSSFFMTLLMLLCAPFEGGCCQSGRITLRNESSSRSSASLEPAHAGGFSTGGSGLSNMAPAGSTAHASPAVGIAGSAARAPRKTYAAAPSLALRPRAWRP
mmetsp:Transcript_74685/g.218829  ORF Transcript_74685/g.218829 Transcript_74685/m.218829 type:complete len:241 (-) Transcript_74685:2-724(-)